MERTFVAIKPDAVQRGFVGEIIQRFERKGFKIIGLKMMHINAETAQKHYAEHVGKPFFENLVKFITSGPIVAMVLEGENAIQKTRELMGETDPAKAKEGTLRHQFGSNIERNVVHGSDGPQTAAFEISYFFNALEIFEY